MENSVNFKSSVLQDTSPVPALPLLWTEGLNALDVFTLAEQHGGVLDQTVDPHASISFNTQNPPGVQPLRLRSISQHSHRGQALQKAGGDEVYTSFNYMYYSLLFI